MRSDEWRASLKVGDTVGVRWRAHGGSRFECDRYATTTVTAVRPTTLELRGTVTTERGEFFVDNGWLRRPEDDRSLIRDMPELEPLDDVFRQQMAAADAATHLAAVRWDYLARSSPERVLEVLRALFAPQTGV